MTHAVFATGGKQYLVKAGDKLRIEKLAGTHKEGDTISFNDVLLSGDSVGTPLVKGAVVTATLKKIGRLPKVTVIKYKQKSRYFKKNGHKQPYFEVQIGEIK